MRSGIDKALRILKNVEGIAHIELDEEEVSGLQLAHFQVADVMDVSRDGATLRYVASNRYRKRAARYV